MTYSEKLKDPRWQKKRLEILERDEWTCVNCGETEKTLHVHHCHYKKGLEPWDYDSKTLKCLCETCHDKFHEAMKVIKQELGELEIEEIHAIRVALAQYKAGFVALAHDVLKFARGYGDYRESVGKGEIDPS